MFNGIIFNKGTIKSIKNNSKSILIGIKSNLKIKKEELGSSISCNGVCLTLVKINKKIIYFYISLVYGQKISGHFTQGHVDTTAKVKKILLIDNSWILKLEFKNRKLIKHLEEKASISINGVSLTISKVSNKNIILNIIPHTLKLTNLKNLRLNDTVNVELDIFGKYIYKYTK